MTTYNFYVGHRLLLSSLSAVHLCPCSSALAQRRSSPLHTYTWQSATLEKQRWWSGTPVCSALLQPLVLRARVRVLRVRLRVLCIRVLKNMYSSPTRVQCWTRLLYITEYRSKTAQKTNQTNSMSYDDEVNLSRLYVLCVCVSESESMLYVDSLLTSQPSRLRKYVILN